jgi:hypothetical protein
MMGTTAVSSRSSSGRKPRHAFGLLLATATLLAPMPALAQACLGMPLPGRATVLAQAAHAPGVDDGSITDFGARAAARIAALGPLDLALHVGAAIGAHGPSDRRNGLFRLDGGAMASLEPMPRLQLCGGALLTRGVYDLEGTDLTHTTLAAVAGGAITLDVGTAALAPYGLIGIGSYDREIAGDGGSGRDGFLEGGATLTLDRYLLGTAILLRHFEYRNQPRLMLRVGMTL